jgi:hypothetical protein
VNYRSLQSSAQIVGFAVRVDEAARMVGTVYRKSMVQLAQVFSKRYEAMGITPTLALEVKEEMDVAPPEFVLNMYFYAARRI